MSTTQMVVDSEPVPAVVGIAISGFSGSQGALPAPIGGVTKSSSSPGWVVSRLTALGGVDGGPAADGDVDVPLLLAGVGDRVLDALVGGLHAHLGEHLGLDAGGHELLGDPVGHARGAHAGVGDHQARPAAEAGHPRRRPRPAHRPRTSAAARPR